jgi:hypothetical protein
MPKILHDNEWYDGLTSSALYEAEFERIVLQKSKLLFPGFLPAAYKRTVYSDIDAARPDYALIEDGYREWWIVELELAHHSFNGHVLPQITALINADYGGEEAAYLAAKNSALDPRALQDLLKGKVPRVLVVVNEVRNEWVAPLRAVGAELAVFEIFRSNRDRYVYRFNGFTPRPPGNVLSRCRLDRTLTWALRLDSPGALDLQRNKPIEMLFGDSFSEWQRLDSSDTVWLVPKARVRLDKRTTYQITRLEDGRLRLAPESDILV